MRRCVLVIFVCCVATMAREGKPGEPCNDTMTFCWYGPYSDQSDEVDAWGNHWVSDDKSESPLEWVTEVRCVHRLNVCILARNQSLSLKDAHITNVDLYKVTRWDGNQVTAVGEQSTFTSCEEDLLSLNRTERSALMTSSPGPSADKERCTKIQGKPMTVMYRLVQ
jgi:hypothetical protein